MTGATGNYYCGLHEVAEMAFALHFLRPTEHFLDVGANIGSYTVLASCTGARVTAVEPIPATYAKLEDNVLINRLVHNVRTCNVGLSGKRDVLCFSANLDTVNHVLPVGSDLPAVEVEVLPMDELLGDDVPVLIKIDVEGHELSVLQGGQRTLCDARLRAVLMETNQSGTRYGVSDDDLRETMRSHGFLACGYDPFLRSMTDARGDAVNTIFVRDRDEANRRVCDAPRFRLINGLI
jgi:FkbM family methyltransferase